MSPRRPTPYVGPKPLDSDDTLFGRDRELNELIDKLFAERIIVLHSPSGAGKSSLINAGVVPELGELEDDEDDDEGSFHVLPVLRVNATLPPAGELPADAAPNRFALSVMMSIEEHLPAARRTTLAELATLRLETYLDRVHKASGSSLPDLLIFDQFEEVLTMDSTDLAQKVDFFSELGQALRSRDRFVIFAIREDYLAALAPYTRKVPTDMKNTYRLDLLGEQGALQAVEGPAREAGVPFAAEAAHRLVDDLRQVTVMGEDGEPRQTLGPHVEPVQLQVVCHELWRDLPEDATTIELSLLKAVGDVNQALAGYYAAEVGLATERTGVKERQIRDWVNNQLITEAGIRGQVLRLSEAAQGLAHAAIDSLVDAHLVRAEQRRGATWYELAHDRLVGPVREDNEAWRKQHLVPLQIQAGIWDQKRRPKDLLLRGEALDEAEAWAASRAQEINKVEADFLEQSRFVRDEDRREEERKEAEQRERDLEQAQALARSRAQAARRLQVGLLAAVLLFTAALAAAVYAYQAKAEADLQRTTAQQQTTLAQQRQKQVEVVQTKIQRQWEQLVVFSAAGLRDDPLTGSLLLSELKGRKEPIRGLATAIELAQQPVPRAILKGHSGRLTSAQLSPDGVWVVTASRDRTARIWRADGRGEPRVLEEHKRPLTVASYGPRGEHVLTASTDGTVRIHKVKGGGSPVVLRGAGKELTHAELSPTGAHALTVSADGLRIFAADGKGEPVHRPDDLPADAHFSPDGALVVVASRDGVGRVVRVADGKLVARLKGHKASLTSARFSPDGKLVATASHDNTARIFKATGKGKKVKLTGHTRPVTAARFSPDGRWVVTVSEDHTARIYPVTGGKPALLRGHSDAISTARFSPDSKLVITASFDDTARVWHASGKGEPMVLRGHQGRVVDARFSADGKQVVMASFDQTASVWKVAEPDKFVTTLRGHSDAVLYVAVGPRGRIVTASKDMTARVWSGRGQLEAELEGHEGAVAMARFSPDGERIVTASLDKTARVWPASGKGPPVVLRGHRGDVLDARFSPDGQRVVTASMDRTALVWQATGKGEPLKLDGHTREVLAARFSPDGKRVVTASVDGTARVFTMVDGKVTGVKVLKGHADEVLAARFSPDGQRIVTASLDRTARIWPLAGGAPVVLAGHRGAVADARFSADGKRVVTASFDKTARVWDSAGKAAPVVLSGHKSWVMSAAFSPDGKYVFTTSASQIHLFHATGKGAPVVLGGHRGQVNGARLMAGATRRLVTASDDRTARIWNLAVSWEVLLDYLRGRTTVCLEPARRVRFLAEAPAKADASYKACERGFNRKGTTEEGTQQREVLFTLVLSPKHAKIHLDGKVVETNPIVVPATGNHHDLKVTAPGHRPWEHEVMADRSRLIKVTLKRRKGSSVRAGRKKPAPAAKPTTASARNKPATAAKKPKPAPKAKSKKPTPPKEPTKKAIYFEDEL